MCRTRIALKGQQHSQQRPAIAGWQSLDRPAVGRDDLYDDGQSESSAASLAVTGFVQPNEPLEHPKPLLGRDSRPVIDHLDDRFFALGP